MFSTAWLRMLEESSKAIVLRIFESGESSLVVRLLTKEFGKVVAVARSAKKSMKRFGAGLDILEFGIATFKSTRSGILPMIEAFTDRGSFSELRNDLDKLTISSVLAECFDLLVKEEIPEPEAAAIFEALELALTAINESKNPKESLKACYLSLSFLTSIVGISDHTERPPSMNALNALLDDIERFLEKQLSTRESLNQIVLLLKR